MTVYITNLKNYFIFLLLVINLPLARGQLGQHSNQIKWRQIDAGPHTIVFPNQFEQQAYRVGSILEYMDRHATRSIGDKVYPLQILLHNQTTIPNGFVGVAPYRSEFFATPPQSGNFLGTVDWLDGLAIHEYRHAQQNANSRVGLTKIAHILMGDNGWGLANSLSPNWFWEGDAVWMETSLSNQGRGRSPFFTRIQRSLVREGIRYSYQKARNESYKDILPNRYRLGYVMTTYARQKFGNDIWKDIFIDASSYRKPIYPFSQSLKKHTGWTTGQLYEEAYQFYEEKWKKEWSKITLSDHRRITKQIPKTVTNFRFPFYLTDGSLVYLKDSFKQTDGLYQLHNGKERRVTTIGFNISDYLSVINDKAAWSEFENNPRRFEQNYSTIITYDFKTQKKARLTKKSRFFTPSYSNDGDRLVAVHISPEQVNKLVILDGLTGDIIQSFDNPDNYFLAFPKWLEEDKGLVFIAKQQGRLALFKYQINEPGYQQLSNWTHHIISDLYVKNDRVYFTASFSGVDNIFSIDLNTPANSSDNLSFSPTLQQHTSVAVGAYFPSLHPNSSQLAFSEYHHQGHYISSIELKKSANKQVERLSIKEPTEQARYLVNQLSQEGGNILDKVVVKNYPVIPYKGVVKGLRLHSWNLTPSVAIPSLDIQMDNLLNDVSFNLLGGYNINEQRTFYSASMTYGKWYPQIQVFAGSGKRNTVFQSPADTLAIQEFSQHTIGSTVSVPLTWRKGNFSTNVRPFINYSHRFIRNPIYEGIERENYTLNTFAIGANLSNLKRTALQQVDTRFGQSINIIYNQTLDDRQDQQFHIESSFYLPGLGANHSIKVDLDYRNQSLSNEYQFADRFEYPRGYGKLPNDRFTKLGINYHLPLVYPDWGFKGITYFKRLRANLFYDYGNANRINFQPVELSSVGIEILFDNHFFMELPVTIGLRNSFLLNKELDKQYDFEFFISSEFF